MEPHCNDIPVTMSSQAFVEQEKGIVSSLRSSFPVFSMELQIYKGMRSMQREKNSTVIYTELVLVIAERNVVNKAVETTIKLQHSCSMQINLLRLNFVEELVSWNLDIS